MIQMKLQTIVLSGKQAKKKEMLIYIFVHFLKIISVNDNN